MVKGWISVDKLLIFAWANINSLSTRSWGTKENHALSITESAGKYSGLFTHRYCWGAIKCYKAEDRSKRNESNNIDRWKSFKYDELVARDKTNLDIFWLKDDSLEDTENLPAPDILAGEIVEQLEAALEEFRSVEDVLLGNEE